MSEKKEEKSGLEKLGVPGLKKDAEKPAEKPPEKSEEKREEKKPEEPQEPPKESPVAAFRADDESLVWGTRIAELQKEMEKVRNEHGGKESDVPYNHNYWVLRNELADLLRKRQAKAEKRDV